MAFRVEHLIFETCFYQNYTLSLNKTVSGVGVCGSLGRGSCPVGAVSQLLGWEGKTGNKPL